ncbi:hypothetical protein GCM10022600_14320 [Qipengyuania pelagi]
METGLRGDCELVGKQADDIASPDRADERPCLSFVRARLSIGFEFIEALRADLVDHAA